MVKSRRKSTRKGVTIKLFNTNVHILPKKISDTVVRFKVNFKYLDKPLEFDVDTLKKKILLKNGLILGNFNSKKISSRKVGGEKKENIDRLTLPLTSNKKRLEENVEQKIEKFKSKSAVKISNLKWTSLMIMTVCITLCIGCTMFLKYSLNGIEIAKLNVELAKAEQPKHVVQGIAHFSTSLLCYALNGGPICYLAFCSTWFDEFIINAY